MSEEEDAKKRLEEQRRVDDQMRIELERLEINAAYENSGYANDGLNESSATLGAKSSPNYKSRENGTGTVRSLPDEHNDRTDRYGFIHETKLPAALTESELKRNNIEKLREKKWLIMLKDWQTYFNGRYFDKLISRVYKGIPNSMRNPIWSKFLDVDTQIKAQSGVYEKMRNMARLYSVDLRQIDLDINRTFRNNLAYKHRYNQRQVQLYNILAAYSIYNTEIGYCQGMATVTALLLMYLSDEEKSFWALSQLMSNSKYSMHGFFKQDFPKLIRYVDKHDMIIKTFLPKIHKKFIKYNITSLLYTTKWFLQCYLDALPFSLVLRIWDVYLLKGDIVMLAMSYCILRLHKRRLLHKEFDMDKINDFLNHKLPEDFLYSDDEVMVKLEECIDKLIKHRFSIGGPILEAIPQNELPKVPFGDFKKIDKNEILSNIKQQSSVQSRNSLDRSAAVELMARERLEVEKRKQEEEKKLRKQQTLEANESGEPSLENILNKSGQPILNISDDDDDFEMSDSEDDLNPSKISEYDEDKAEKESIISNITRHSHLQIARLIGRESNSLGSSQISLEGVMSGEETVRSQKGKAPVLAAAEGDESERVLTRQMSEYDNGNQKQANVISSDYENLSNKPSPVRESSFSNQQHTTSQHQQHQQVTNIAVKKSAIINSPQKSFNFNTNIPVKSYSYDKQRMQSSDNLSGGVTSFTPNRTTIPQSQSYIISPNYAKETYATTASIMSSPPPISPTAYMARSQSGVSQSSAHIASIITNPSYYSTNTTTTFNQSSQEYVRSPHGIYTRVNSGSCLTTTGDSKHSVKKSPSFRIMPHTSGGITQSTSSFIISSSSLTKQSSTVSSKNMAPSKSPPMNNSNVVHPNLLVQQPPSSANPTNTTPPKPAPNALNKRTSSLRSIQNKFTNHFINGSTSASKLNKTTLQQQNYATPTKLNLQNHSLRIANIQQKQAHLNSYHTEKSPKASSHQIKSNTNYPTISIISQGPIKASLNSNNSQYGPIFQRPPIGQSASFQSGENGQEKTKHSNSKLIDNEDLIEQYDYI